MVLLLHYGHERNCSPFFIISMNPVILTLTFFCLEKWHLGKWLEFQRMAQWNFIRILWESFSDIDIPQKCTMNNNEYFLYNGFVEREVLRPIT